MKEIPSFPDIDKKEVREYLRVITKRLRDRKIEKLAAIEHEQWIYWSKGTTPIIKDLLIALEEYRDAIRNEKVPSKELHSLVQEWNIVIAQTNERLDRWERLQNTPYADLTEELKEDDRKWAVKALEAIEE